MVQRTLTAFPIPLRLSTLPSITPLMHIHIEMLQDFQYVVVRN